MTARFSPFPDREANADARHALQVTCPRTMEWLMNPRSKCARQLAALFVICLSALAGAPPAAAAPNFDTVLSQLGYTPEDKAALLQGGIVAKDLRRTGDNQLVAAVAVLLKTPLAALAENARMGLNIERDEAVTAFGRLDGASGAGQFSAASYLEADWREVERLAAAPADGTFNLSKAELEGLREALKAMPSGRAAAAERASRAYQAVLAGRYQAYLESGLDGIGDYEAGPRLKPADDLRGALAQATPFLEKFFPDFASALSGFPAVQAAGITNNFYWMKRDVEGRPAFILAHQMVQAGSDFALLSQRQYFVGHTYQSLQVIALALPLEEQTAVFYVNSAYTDKITGFFSGVAESVGQSRTKENLIEYFNQARKRLQ